jgi:hypothetical protein
MKMSKGAFFALNVAVMLAIIWMFVLCVVGLFLAVHYVTGSPGWAFIITGTTTFGLIIGALFAHDQHIKRENGRFGI